jgi:hypothetical protein
MMFSKLPMRFGTIQKKNSLRLIYLKIILSPMRVMKIMKPNPVQMTVMLRLMAKVNKSLRPKPKVKMAIKKKNRHQTLAKMVKRKVMMRVKTKMV